MAHEKDTCLQYENGNKNTEHHSAWLLLGMCTTGEFKISFCHFVRVCKRPGAVSTNFRLQVSVSR